VRRGVVQISAVTTGSSTTTRLILTFSTLKGGEGTLSRRLFQLAPNSLYDSLEIFQHLAVPESNNPVAVPRKLRTALTVRDRPRIMLTTIALDRELSLRTSKIGDAPSDRMLPSEFPG